MEASRTISASRPLLAASWFFPHSSQPLLPSSTACHGQPPWAHTQDFTTSYHHLLLCHWVTSRGPRLSHSPEATLAWSSSQRATGRWCPCARKPLMQSKQQDSEHRSTGHPTCPLGDPPCPPPLLLLSPQTYSCIFLQMSGVLSP